MDNKTAEFSDKKLFIFDMDGTVYLGDKAFPEAIEFVTLITSQPGKKVLFFTNNASKNTTYYREKIKKMGFPSDKIDLLTSADALISYLLAHRSGQSVYLLGTDLLASSFATAGVLLTDSKPDIVVTSFDTSLTYHRLERACTYIRNGSEWLTTHPDINCPVENGGYVPDCGAINALISVSTGKPLPSAFGKPSGGVIDMLEELYKIPRSDMVMFGDRLYTDVALGKDNGVTAVLMLTGEGTLADAEALPESKRPDYIFSDFKCILPMFAGGRGNPTCTTGEFPSPPRTPALPPARPPVS